MWVVTESFPLYARDCCGFPFPNNQLEKLTSDRQHFLNFELIHHGGGMQSRLNAWHDYVVLVKHGCEILFVV